MSHEQTAETDNWAEIDRVSRAALPPEIVQLIDKARSSERPESQLISVLHKVQQKNGYLGKEQLDAVAYLLNVPAAKVTGVATFYHLFRLQPRGRYMINVCLGTACYVNGAKKVVSKFMEELGVEIGQTTADGMYTLESTMCIGTCGLGPVVTINEEVQAKVQPDQVPLILSRIAERDKAN